MDGEVCLLEFIDQPLRLVDKLFQLAEQFPDLEVLAGWPVQLRCSLENRFDLIIYARQ